MPKTIVEMFSEESLNENSYLEYSQQFLSKEEIERISLQTNPQEQLNLRAKLLCESGKDPFSPPLNSFSQSKQLHIDAERVTSCFMQAYKLYKQVSEKLQEELEPARLYKLGWAKEKTEPVFKRLIEIWEKIKKLNQEDAFYQLVKELQSTEQDQLISKALSNHKDSITKALTSRSLIAKNNALRPILAEIKKCITELVGFEVFRSSRNYKQLQSIGSVYDPGDIAGKVTHSWGTNLAWTLAHIRQGNIFIVCSDILQNKYRGNYDNTPCAFAREICVALKAGYTLDVNIPERKVTLCPDGLKKEHLKQLDSTGELGNGVNPTFQEIDLIFTELESKFHSKQYFTYRYNAPQANTTSNLDRSRELMLLSEPKEPLTGKETVEIQKQDPIKIQQGDDLTDTRRGEKRKRSPSPK